MQSIAVRSFVLLSLIASGPLFAQTPASADSARKPAPTVLPASAPADGEVSHVVKKGDTLWDIAKAYLKDPFRWPEVFQRNTDVVENPHWIYPGEVIRIANGEVRPEVLARVTTKPVPVVVEPDRTVFAAQIMTPNGRLQSSGEVLGRVPAGAVRVPDRRCSRDL